MELQQSPGKPEYSSPSHSLVGHPNSVMVGPQAPDGLGRAAVRGFSPDAAIRSPWTFVSRWWVEWIQIDECESCINPTYFTLAPCTDPEFHPFFPSDKASFRDPKSVSRFFVREKPCLAAGKMSRRTLGVHDRSLNSEGLVIVLRSERVLAHNSLGARQVETV